MIQYTLKSTFLKYSYIYYLKGAIGPTKSCGCVSLHNMSGDVVNGEEVFLSSVVYCVGTVIGLVAADTELHAQQASKLIDIGYECLEPLTFTIDQAIE